MLAEYKQEHGDNLAKAYAEILDAWANKDVDALQYPEGHLTAYWFLNSAERVAIDKLGKYYLNTYI